MASGFGTFDSTPTHIGGTTSYMTTAVVTQSVNTSARTVTVTVTAYASFYRDSGSSWSVSQGTNFWTTDHSDAYMDVSIGGNTERLSTRIGVASSKSQTVVAGQAYTVPNGKAQAANGYGVSKTISKTYNYDSAGSAITGSWSIKLHAYESLHGYGWHDVEQSDSFTTDSIPSTATSPSGAKATFVSTTYNEVTMTSTINSWGTGYSGIPNLECIIINPAATTSTLTSYGRFLKRTSTTGKTYTASVSNDNADASYKGGYVLKGATPFRVACWASTSVGEAHSVNGTTYGTPPAPIQTLSKVETAGATAVSTAISVTGASSSLNSSNSVKTQIRVSPNGGSTWSPNWTDIGTGTAWTTKSTTVNVPYGTNTKIQARQVYTVNNTNYYSDTKELSYTSMAATRPENPSVTVNSVAWNSVSLSGSIDNYGRPSGASGRKLNIGVADGNSGSPAGMEKQTANATSATVTVDNNSVAIRGGLTLKGMMSVYPYTYATNTIMNNIVYGNAITLAPASGTLSYSVDPNNISQQTISYVGVAANNDPNYDPTLLTRTVRYADVSDPTNWTYIENDTVVALTTTTTQTISVGAQHTITVEAWMTYDGNQSEVSTVQLTNSSAQARMYGSVNSEAETIERLYGAVDGNILTGIAIDPNATPPTYITAIDSDLFCQMFAVSSSLSGARGDIQVAGWTVKSIEVGTSLDGYYFFVSTGDGVAVESYLVVEDVTADELAGVLGGFGISTVSGAAIPVADAASTISTISVGKVTKKLIKFYASVNGVAKLIHED